MSDMNPVTGGSASALSPATVGGRRRHMKKVSAKTIKRTLKRLGMKPKGRVVIRGGGEDSEDGDKNLLGGRRRRHTKKTHRRRHSRRIFGLKY
jgi:hypothetical protein